jgi:hypothetical protein
MTMVFSVRLMAKRSYGDYRKEILCLKIITDEKYITSERYSNECN